MLNGKAQAVCPSNSRTRSCSLVLLLMMVLRFLANAVRLHREIKCMTKEKTYYVHVKLFYS